jgi:hypothetical protein
MSMIQVKVDGGMTVEDKPPRPMPAKSETRVATLAVGLNGDHWSVDVEAIPGTPSGHRITYSSTRLDVYVVKTGNAHMVAVPNYGTSAIIEYFDAYACRQLATFNRDIDQGNLADGASIAAFLKWRVGGAA